MERCSGCDPLTPDDIAEVVVFVAGRPQNVVVADTLIFPSHQVCFEMRLRACLLSTRSANPCTGGCRCAAQEVRIGADPGADPSQDVAKVGHLWPAENLKTPIDHVDNKIITLLSHRPVFLLLFCDLVEGMPLEYGMGASVALTLRAETALHKRAIPKRALTHHKTRLCSVVVITLDFDDTSLSFQ